MYKENPINLFGLKALAWDVKSGAFISPARPDFIWSEGGLQMSFCNRCKGAPQADCTCGLYATYDIEIAFEYTHTSIISPIFLIEASGIVHCYEDGFRAEEATILSVAPVNLSKEGLLSAKQASYYFQIPFVDEIEPLVIAMDIHNMALFPTVYKKARSKIIQEQNFTYDQINALYKQGERAKNG